MLLKSLYLLLVMPLVMSFYDPSFERELHPEIGPNGMPYNKTTSCEEFGKYARFNPHSISGTRWLVFYYWAPPKPTLIFDLWIPSKYDMMIIHRELSGHEPKNFNWSATMLVMRNVLNNSTLLLVEQDDRGLYLAIDFYQDKPKGVIAEYAKLRIKQTGNKKYIGIVDCAQEIALILCHIMEIPRQNRLQDEASTLGYIGRKGKSYLYSGHDWMPVPEQDEKEFWRRTKLRHGFMGDKRNGTSVEKVGVGHL